jgi:hypothetical protein
VSRGKKWASAAELRQLFNENLGAGARPLNQAQFAEVLGQMQGGGVVAAFSATVVQFA